MKNRRPALALSLALSLIFSFICLPRAGRTQENDAALASPFPKTVITTRSSNSPYAQTNNAFYHTSAGLAGQCTWYAYGRVIELAEAGYLSASAVTLMHDTFWGISGRDAKNWPNLLHGEWTSTSAAPLPLDKRNPGMLVVWPFGLHGHVAFVEEVSADKSMYRVSDFNYTQLAYREHWYSFEGTSDAISGVYPKFYQLPLNIQPTNFGGYLDRADCDLIGGWAWDSSQPNTPINVNIYDGDNYVATVAADQFRSDLANAGFGNGRHAYNLPTPAYLKDGRAHNIRVKFASNGADLRGTPKTLTCGSYGYLDHADCSVIYGWAWDSAQPSTPVNIDLYEGDNYLTTVAADQYRPDLASAGFGDGRHGFTLSTPAALRQSAGPYSLRAVISGTDFQLLNSPTPVACGGAIGYLDRADCDLIGGWAWDSGQPNTAVNLDIYDGDTTSPRSRPISSALT